MKLKKSFQAPTMQGATGIQNGIEEYADAPGSESKMCESNTCLSASCNDNTADNEFSNGINVHSNSNGVNITQSNGHSVPTESELCESSTCFFESCDDNSIDKELSNGIDNIHLNSNGIDVAQSNGAHSMDISTITEPNTHVELNSDINSHNTDLCEINSLQQIQETESLEDQVKTPDEFVAPTDYLPTENENSSTYSDSAGSYDSGRGGSDIQCEPVQGIEFSENVSYEFEIPQEYVGRLIGKKGKTVKAIKANTNADIFINDHPYTNRSKVCSVSGTQEAVNNALCQIKQKFPLEHYPTVTLAQIHYLPQIPEDSMLTLPKGPFQAVLACTVSAGHFFLRQPSHPTFHTLEGLTYAMNAHYRNHTTAPPLPCLETGYVCAAEYHNSWYRVEIREVFGNGECNLKFLDYGGYYILPGSSLRQINVQFLQVPFQASECYLGLVTVPEGETEWSREATKVFRSLVEGKVVIADILDNAEDGVAVVRLRVGNPLIDVHEELVRLGFARPIESLEPAA